MVQGFKQSELGERLGCSQSAVSRMEKGELVPNAEMIPQLARALRCMVTDLLPETEDAPFQITVRPA